MSSQPWSVVGAIDAVTAMRPDSIAVETWSERAAASGGPCGGAPGGQSSAISTTTFRQLQALAEAVANGLASVSGVADAAVAEWPSQRPQEGADTHVPTVLPVGVCSPLSQLPLPSLRAIECMLTCTSIQLSSRRPCMLRQDYRSSDLPNGLGSMNTDVLHVSPHVTCV